MQYLYFKENGVLWIKAKKSVSELESIYPDPIIVDNDYDTMVLDDTIERQESQEAVYETVTKQRQKVVVSEVEEEVSSTEIVLEDGKYVQKTTTETVTKEVPEPQYEEVPLYDEDGEEIGTHTIPVMEEYETEVLVSGAVQADEVMLPPKREKTREEIESDLDYSLKRMAEYPDVKTQLDYIYHNGLSSWKSDMIKPVKDMYPK